METMDTPGPATEATVPLRDTTSFPRGSSGELHTQELGITYQKLGKTQLSPPLTDWHTGEASPTPGNP